MSILSGSAILPTEGGAPSGLDRKALMSMAETSSLGRMMPTFNKCARACVSQLLFLICKSCKFHHHHHDSEQRFEFLVQPGDP